MNSLLKVFYHLYIPESAFAAVWPVWIDQQLGLIKQSGLSDNAQIYITITMPKYWNGLGGWPFKKTSSNPDQLEFNYCLFFEKVTEYINIRYPFVTILNIRDSGETNIYEGECLRFLHLSSQKSDSLYLYFHSKGISTITMPATHSWREVLNHYMITEWKQCVSLLENHDVVGVLDADHKKNIAAGIPITPSGNFWWARGDYIRKLPHPLAVHEYVEDPTHYPGGPAYRYSFERWISSGLPKLGVIANTNTTHYDNYCFLEKLPAQTHYTVNTSDYI